MVDRLRKACFGDINSPGGYERFLSVSVKWRSGSFSLASGNVCIVHHSDVLGNQEAVQRRRFLCIVFRG